MTGAAADRATRSEITAPEKLDQRASAIEHSPARWQDIQGLRAIAVLIVVAFHAGLPVSGGFVGVDVFFVISGYVITMMLCREWQATGSIDLSRFYVRRAFRLLPALALTLSAVMFASIFLLSLDGPQQAVARTGIAALFLAANVVIANSTGDYFAPEATQNPLLHTWSLSLEEQFYLVFPFLLLGTLRLGRKFGKPIVLPTAILSAAIAMSLAVSVVWVNGPVFGGAITSLFGGPQVFAFYCLPARIWEFGAGCLIAIAAPRGFAKSRLFREATGAIGFGLIAVAAIALDESMAFPGWLATVPVLGTLLLIAAGSADGSVSSRILSWKPLTTVGDWSYSIYLWHWPLIVFAGVVFPDSRLAPLLAAALAFAPAYLSFIHVEQPLRKWRPRRFRPLAVALAGFALAPLALANTLHVGAMSGWGGIIEAPEPTSARPEESFDRPIINRAWRSAHAVVAAGCVDSPIDPIACRFGPREDAGTILLLGDSQAYSMGDGVIAAADDLGYSVVASSRVGCPFAGHVAMESKQKGCSEWQQQALQFAIESRPDLVVIVNRAPRYIYPKNTWGTRMNDQTRDEPAIKRAIAKWRRAIEEVISPLDESGIPVLLAASVAEMPPTAVQRSIFAQAYGGARIGVTRNDALEYRRPAFEIAQDVADRYSAVSLLDPLEALCDYTCPSAIGEMLLYRDATHLSLDGALRLTPHFTHALTNILGARDATEQS